MTLKDKRDNFCLSVTVIFENMSIKRALKPRSSMPYLIVSMIKLRENELKNIASYVSTAAGRLQVAGKLSLTVQFIFTTDC